jgi:hypothetical protein
MQICGNRVLFTLFLLTVSTIPTPAQSNALHPTTIAEGLGKVSKTRYHILKVVKLFFHHIRLQFFAAAATACN